MRLARSLARADIEPRGSRGREPRVSEERISALLLGRARRSSLARSARNVCARAREKMEFSGVELQVEISIGGQRGLVSHARAGAAAFLISLFSTRPLPSSIATCSSSSSSLPLSFSPLRYSGFVLRIYVPPLFLSLLFLALRSRSSFFPSFGVGADVL